MSDAVLWVGVVAKEHGMARDYLSDMVVSKGSSEREMRFLFITAIIGS